MAEKLASKKVEVGSFVKLKKGSMFAKVSSAIMRVTDIHGKDDWLATCHWSEGDKNRTTVFPVEELEAK